MINSKNIFIIFSPILFSFIFVIYFLLDTSLESQVYLRESACNVFDSGCNNFSDFSNTTTSIKCNEDINSPLNKNVSEFHEAVMHEWKNETKSRDHCLVEEAEDQPKNFVSVKH